MIWLSPKSLTLLGAELDGVRAVTVSRQAVSVVEDRTDEGPYAVFVDTPEIRVEVVIERTLQHGPAGLLDLHPGSMGTLTLVAAPSGASAHEEEIVAEVVVTGVSHTLHGSGGPTQKITCRCVSADGADAPLAAPSKK